MSFRRTNSAADLRSMPVKYLFLDEVDAYPDDVDGEGDPIDLARRRAATFVRRKELITSTPTLKDASNVERELATTDKRLYHVPCPHCDHGQVLRDENLLDDGRYLCEGCGEPIDHHHKTSMLDQGEWIPSQPRFEDRGYQISTLYSPIGLGYTWSEIAEERKKVKDDPAKHKVYVNTILGEAYETTEGRTEPEELAKCAEEWNLRNIPKGGLLLTAGVDVQKNRFAILIVVWGRGEECWIVDWLELPGDPTREESWNELDEYLNRPIPNSRNLDMRISIAAVDSGNWTHEVYNFVRTCQHLGMVAIKGLSTGGKPIIGRPSAQDVNFLGKRIRRGVQLWTVGTDTAKNTLMARTPGVVGRPLDKRRIHFTEDLPDDFYQQLTAEVLDISSGRWAKIKGRRNEALDCFVYAYAAACHPRVRVPQMREVDWVRLEEKYEPHTADLFADTGPPETKEKPKSPPKFENSVNRPRSHRSNWNRDGW